MVIPLKNESFSKEKERVLISGCCGFIGRHMTDYLLKKGYHVEGIDNLSVGKKIPEGLKRFGFWDMDLTDPYMDWDMVFKAIEPDYVIHLAAFARIQPSIEEPIKWITNNVNSTINVLEASRKVGVKKVVFTSSSSVYGDNKIPFQESMKVDIKTPYALSKYFGEEMCKLYNRIYKLPCVSVRYFNVYGKGQIKTGKFATVIGIMLHEKETGKKITIVGDGKQRRDFTYIDDIVEGTYKAMLYGRGGEIYNLGCGKNYRIKYLAKLIQPNVKMHKQGYQRLQEAWETQADIDKARLELRWNPRYSLKKGLKEVMK